MGTKTRSRDPILERRDVLAGTRPDADSLRRTFPGLSGSVLCASGEWTRRPVHGRPAPGLSGQALRELHVQLSEFRSARRRQRPPHRLRAGAILIHETLRGLAQLRRATRRQGGRASIGGSLLAGTRTRCTRRESSHAIGSCYTNASFRGEKFPRFGNTFVSESSATPNQDARVAPY